jgi:hypothetical protein
MIQESIDQDKAIVELEINLHQTLTASCGHPKKDTWHLLGRLVRRFCIHLHGVCALAMGVNNISTMGSKALVMWVMMHSLKVARDILDAGFQAYPIIIQEVIEFQLEHRVDTTHLTELPVQIDSLKTQVKDLTLVLSGADKAQMASPTSSTRCNRKLVTQRRR